MLGETANIRTNNKDYFQILILPDEMPYYNNRGIIIKWEKLTAHNIDKYIALSKDNTNRFFHTPVKTLLLIIKFPNCDHNKITTKTKYKQYYLNQIPDSPIQTSANINSVFGNTIILNDYEVFIEKITHYIKSI
ncbi:MAG: hypothetical protein UR69_C0002G0141 [Candidatus Moranbacteria bacterium GW2011_GWE2_35_2-]|nr:MAG: hypothetical protein UR69_C0002G0141 [Candidatus Moranbacteria bacterium GW2011_GWE2_35_2-]KKQ04300.1 MAG: hypothetical protein US15_C0061G0007 [Candidatus Moranbacteria bacterium GW2011_GWF1_36_4]KKQ22509.1 MAG: hypothetical protein US37_C0002G0134 [Candidatus Moranbacteria bacterium GW2011_GWF2_37_11]KKQ29578.1 MAG: hypothetical protein US44_C0001G0170 [Candidatus Moranbacteria bacterium GW2011_GWD1_37_17]KKQ30551.1 MAG: hypothetical protein US47_C0002G0141 [Candidatus Moranbacteria b